MAYNDFFEREWKGMNTILLFLWFTLFGILLIIGIIFVNNNIKIILPNFKTTLDQCQEICKSNRMEFYKIEYGGYSNDVCYCRDEGKIKTFVM